MSRHTIAALVAFSMMAGAPAMANTPDSTAPIARSVASKLSLAAAAGPEARNNCVTRLDADGRWRLDVAGNWVRCRRAGGWLIAGAIGALGLGLGLGLGNGNGNNGPSSP